MPITVILAIGVDLSSIRAQETIWQSAEYFVRSVATIGEAIDQFRDGDFDLVLLGHRVPAESREQLAFLIRKSGSQIPVVSVTNSAGGYDAFADATLIDEPNALLEGIGRLLTGPAIIPSAKVPGRVTSQPGSIPVASPAFAPNCLNWQPTPAVRLHPGNLSHSVNTARRPLALIETAG
jgi:CheY-like chemotaxis protein